MRYAEYVVTGWALTGATIAGYWLWIVRRTRRAEQSWAQQSLEGAEVEVE